MATKPRKPRLRTVREVSAGGLLWQREGNRLAVVLVRPAGRKTWVLPKGGLEPDETSEQAAIRECREETGFAVSLDRPLGQITYFYTRREDGGAPVRVLKRVDFYLMKCAGGDASRHDAEIEEVRWFPIDEALAQATYRNERDLIAKGREKLSGETVVSR